MIDPIAEVASEVPIYWRNSDLWLAGICIIFNPLFWNIVSWLVYIVRIHLSKIIIISFLLFYRASLNITLCEVSSLYKDYYYYYIG